MPESLVLAVTLPRSVMNSRHAWGSEREEQKGEGERAGCVRLEFGDRDRGYLGNGPTPTLGVAP